MYDLSGKVAIVTGAGGVKGFGRAIARRLAKEGTDVVVVDRTRCPVRAEEIADNWEGIDSVA
jgi:3-oxoacyl-[acyl-carrier protein] reductase/meso-butanediol dehydrogenase/(S,S)-butanediol dehydrogenase/diacetyl reductase